MSQHEEFGYHSRRALRELDLGLTATCVAAARAHFELSSLHMQRAREASAGREVLRPLLEM
jgi:hypothetical protein